MKNFIRKYHHLAMCLLLTAISLVFTFTVFRGSFGTLTNSASQLWDSVVSYFRFLFFLETPTQNPIIPPPNDSNILPSDPAEIGNNFSAFFRLLFNGRNFTAYLRTLEGLLVTFVRVLPFVIVLAILLKKLYRRSLSQENNDYNKDTKPLATLKRVSSVTYTPTKRYLLGLYEYIGQSKFPRIWLLIWLFNFNVFAILLSLIATVLFFSISFNFVSLYTFVYSSVVMSLPALRFIPIWVWLIIVLWRIDIWRKRKALQRLMHMENKNKGFILERSICTMLVGTMGKGKTTIVTDISLSTEAIFRSKAYELMLECDLKFPNFPYIVLENALKKQIERGAVFNLASCDSWLGKVQKKHERTGCKPFDYDYKKYGLHYNDKKTLVYLFDVLRDYAKLYLIYITQSSLILSNYAIRTDFAKIDRGNLPLWNLDFFQKDARYLNRTSRRSHILDFDMLRLGKKLVENNRLANVFEFGVIAITETGKERGNQFKDKEIKDTIANLRTTIKDLERAKRDNSAQQKQLADLTERATQLTDKFNDSLKLIRHKCTVMGFPFARVFLDEQRPESLGADARDLCEIVHIRGKSETRLSMPFFFIGELVYAFVFGRFAGAYREYRFNRGDNTLFMYSLKKLGATVHQSYSRTYNRFGFHVVALAVEDASTGQVTKETNYYLSTKKIYSNRFSTDAYGDIFAKDLKCVGLGLDDIPE